MPWLPHQYSFRNPLSTETAIAGNFSSDSPGVGGGGWWPRERRFSCEEAGSAAALMPPERSSSQDGHGFGR